MTLKIGSAVIWIDSMRQPHNALVTAIHGDAENKPAINLLIVSDDANKRDEYGRQIERQTSVVHIGNNSAGAFCWKFPEE